MKDFSTNMGRKKNYDYKSKRGHPHLKASSF